MICPDEMDVSSMPPIIGNICRPDAVGVACFATCRKSGRYVTEPYSAKPTTKPTLDVTENARFENRRSGSTGSAARRSTKRNPIIEMTAAMIIEIVNGDDQL